MSRNLGIDELGVDVKVYVEEFKRSILEKLGGTVKSIVVFGSRVRGQWRPWSDIDILVIVKTLSEDIERFKLIPYVPLVQVWMYTEEEFYESLRKFDIALLDALEHGIIIYDDGFWSRAKEYFQKFKSEWELIGDEYGWISRKIERDSMKNRSHLSDASTSYGT